MRTRSRICHLCAINRRLWPWRSTAEASRHSRTGASGSSDRNCAGSSVKVFCLTRTVRRERTWRRLRQSCWYQVADATASAAKRHLCTSNIRRLTPVAIGLRHKRLYSPRNGTSSTVTTKHVNSKLKQVYQRRYENRRSPKPKLH